MNNTTRQYILLTVAILFGFGVGLTSYGILNNNEGLYAQIGWETLTGGHWVIPHLNGVPYIEKPPLLYWLLAFSFKIFGKTVFAARCVPSLFGALTVFSWIWFGHRIQQKLLGFWAAFLLSTSLGFIVFSRMVFFDIVLTFFLSLSLFHFYLAYHSRSRLNLFLMWGLLALAILTKGFVALLLWGGITTLFILLERAWNFLLFLLNPLGIALFLAIVAPWHIAASYENHHFAWFYFINEHVMRFLDLRIPKDYYTGSVFYYLPRLWAYLLPWGAIFPFFLLKKTAWINLWRALTGKKSLDPFLKFLWIWFGVIFVFFSCSRAKANYYMIAAVPPLCGCIAWWFQHISHRLRWAVGFVLFNAMLIITACILLPKYEKKLSAQPFFKEYPIYEKLVYYKRFEELSSFLFYLKTPIPIMKSESRDLWFAQHHGYGPSIFVDTNYEDGPFYLIVLKRDLEDFARDFPHEMKVMYDSETYKIFKKGWGR